MKVNCDECGKFCLIPPNFDPKYHTLICRRCSPFEDGMEGTPTGVKSE